MPVTRDDVHGYVFLAGQVTRFHTWPTIHKPNVAEHCWRVATLYAEIFGLPRAEVLYFCLHHDSGELFAGDVPFGAKRAVPGLPDAMNQGEEMGRALLGVQLPRLDGLEWTRFKICDLLEMYEFGRHEWRMGNEYARPIVVATAVAAKKLSGRAGQETHFKVSEWLMKHGHTQEMEQE